MAKRSRRQLGVLAFLVRDEARVFCYANATVRKSGQNGEILRFAEEWKRRTGAWPGELIFDSRLTTYANLARLEEPGIRFITLRRRGPKLLAAIAAAPRSDWQRIILHNVGRTCHHPRMLDRSVTLKGYPDSIRQLAITDLGHDKPTLLLTNHSDQAPARLVDRYARRMLVDSAIAQAIDLFHTDALSAAVPLQIDVDLQLTVMAAILYRLLADQIGRATSARPPARCSASSSTPAHARDRRAHPHRPLPAPRQQPVSHQVRNRREEMPHPVARQPSAPLHVRRERQAKCHIMNCRGKAG